MRTFIAVDLSKPARKEVKALIEDLKEKHWKAKWVKTGKLHLTLVFIGNIKKPRLPELKQAVNKGIKNLSPFKISLKGLGVFPDFDWPKVLWLGLKGDLHSLAKMQKNIAKELHEKDFQFDKRPFRPHITIGRVKRARAAHKREIGRQVKALREMDLSAEIFVNKVYIYKSKTLTSGSVHSKIASFRLD